MTRLRFTRESDGRRALTRRSMRRHGGARKVASQAEGRPVKPTLRLATLAVCLLPGLSHGCRPPPEALRPPRVPAEQAMLDAGSVAPDPGLELRHPTDRAGFDIEARDGVQAFRALMSASREVATGSDVVGQAIVDSSSNQLFDLLNRNNYQKGAWVLHMLRRHIGDEAFFRGIRDYYAGNLHGVALTGDVRAAFEEASGRELGWFFDQWVHAPGHPQLEVEWGAEAEDLVLSIRQVQPPEWPVFTLELDFEVQGDAADGRRAAVRVDAREATLTIPGAAGAEGLRFDPDVSVRATAELRRR